MELLIGGREGAAEGFQVIIHTTKKKYGAYQEGNITTRQFKFARKIGITGFQFFCSA